MMNLSNLKEKNINIKDWRRRFLALVMTLSLLISSCGLTAFAESEADSDGYIYSEPVGVPAPWGSTSPEPEEGENAETPAPEGKSETETGTEEGIGREEPAEGEEPTGTEGEPEESEEPEPEDLTVYEAGTLTAEADDVQVTLDYTAEARMPEGTILTINRAAGGAFYGAMKSAAKVLRTEINETWQREMGDEAVFYAIALTNPEGNEVHPKAGVTLTCDNLIIPADATGFVTGDNAENIDWDGTLTIDFLPDAIGYAYLKQVQIGNITLVHEGADYTVIATYGPDAGFPAGTRLEVREIMPGTAEYALYSGMTEETLGDDWKEITLERYFDITFVHGEEELEPQADVDVQITFHEKLEQNEETDIQAVHIEENEATVIETDTDSTKVAVHDDEAIDTVTFTSDSFSVYGVVQRKKIVTKVLDAQGHTYEIEVTYNEDAEIPEGAQVKVEEIPEGSDLWEAYRIQTAAALNADDVVMPGLYDITIVDAEGNPIEPKAAVNVAIKLLKDENTTEDIQVVHFTEEMPQELVEAVAHPEEQTTEQIETQTEEQPEGQTQPEEPVQTIESETIDATVDGDVVTFETNGFSVYAFVYTVDFEYKGASYEMLGNEVIPLSKLLAELETGTDISMVTGVSYTGSALELQETEEHDWMIRLIPEAEEQSVLTVRTADTVLEINVTATGKESLDLGDAVITAANGVYLPENAAGRIEYAGENEEIISLIQGSGAETTPPENTEEETPSPAETGTSGESAGDESGEADTPEAGSTETGDTDTPDAGSTETVTISKTCYQVYDISLENVNEENYEAGFQVDMKLTEAIQGRDVRLYHVHGDQVTEIQDFELTENNLTFVTENFSYFVISYTVDFEYIDETGVVHAWSFPGIGSHSLREVLGELGIEAEKITAVELVRTETVGEFGEKDLYLTQDENGEWFINSDAAFDDTYLLTVTADEKVYKITVTDEQETNYNPVWNVTINLKERDGQEADIEKLSGLRYMTYGVMAVIYDKYEGMPLGYKIVGTDFRTYPEYDHNNPDSYVNSRQVNLDLTNCMKIIQNGNGDWVDAGAVLTYNSANGCWVVDSELIYPQNVDIQFEIFEGTDSTASTSRTLVRDWENKKYEDAYRHSRSVSGFEFMPWPNGRVVNASNHTASLNLRRSNTKTYELCVRVAPEGVGIPESDYLYAYVRLNAGYEDEKTGKVQIKCDSNTDNTEKEYTFSNIEWHKTKIGTADRQNLTNPMFTGDETVEVFLFQKKANNTFEQCDFDGIYTQVFPTNNNPNTYCEIKDGDPAYGMKASLTPIRQIVNDDANGVTKIIDTISFLPLNPTGTITKSYIDSYLRDARDFGYYTLAYIGHSGDIEATIGAHYMNAEFHADYGYSQRNVQVNILKVKKVFVDANGGPKSNQTVTINLYKADEDGNTTGAAIATKSDETNAKGILEVEFTGLEAGKYIVSEVLENGTEIFPGTSGQVSGITTTFSAADLSFVKNGNVNYFGTIGYNDDELIKKMLDKGKRVPLVILTNTPDTAKMINDYVAGYPNDYGDNVKSFVNGTNGYKHYDIPSDMVKLRVLSDVLADATDSTSVRVVNIKASELTEEGLSFANENRFIVVNVWMDQDTFCPMVRLNGKTLEGDFGRGGKENSTKVLFNLRSADGTQGYGQGKDDSSQALFNTSKTGAGVILAPWANAHELGGVFGGTIISKWVDRQGNEIHSDSPNKRQTLNITIQNIEGTPQVGMLELRKVYADPSIKDLITWFPFKVTLTHSDQTKVQGKTFPASGLKDDKDEVTFDGNGEAIVWVRADNSVTISNLPADTNYTVEEILPQDSQYVHVLTIDDCDDLTDGKGVIVVGKTSHVTVTNDIPRSGLRLKKSVTVNGESTATALADGEYTFTITGPEDSTDTVATVIIKIENGVATQYKLNNAESFTALPADKYVLIENLAPGNYTITEANPTNGTVISKINDINSEVYFTNVTVVTGGYASASFVNDKTVTGSLIVTKHVQLNGTDTPVTENKTFKVGLYELNGTEWVAVKDPSDSNKNWVKEITVPVGNSTNMEEVKFDDLTIGKTYRVYELNENITIAENDLYQEYQVTYGDANGVEITITEASKKTTVTNNKKTTTIGATKCWGDTTNTATTPFGTEITWTISAVDSDNENVIAKIIPNEADRTQTRNESPWTVQWNNLPMVVDGKAVTYTVTETSAKYGDYTYTTDEITAANNSVNNTIPGTFTFTNPLPTRDIVVEKAWSPVGWPEDIHSVTIGLYAMSGDATTPTPYPYEQSQRIVTITKENSAANVGSELIAQRKFTDLPVYDANGNIITYSVQEITVTSVNGTAVAVTGSSVTVNSINWTVLNGVVSNEGTARVTNTNTGISINITKQWTKDKQPKTTATSIGFTLHQVLTADDGTTKQDTVYSDYVTNGFGIVTYNTENNDWNTVTITNLPLTVKQTVEGAEVTYSASYYVVETDAAADAGYILTTEYSTDGGTNKVNNGSEAAVSSNGSTITIINTETAGVELPSTGGSGTLIYTVAGMGLIVLAGMLLVMRRRRYNR